MVFGLHLEKVIGTYFAGLSCFHAPGSNSGCVMQYCRLMTGSALNVKTVRLKHSPIVKEMGKSMGIHEGVGRLY